MSGRVSFVSLGPGDAGLLGERARRRIDEADVVVSHGAGNESSAAQLVELARAGRRVVRTAPGDALESVGVLAEVLAVARSGVELEVVPGVGARAAAAAFAGVVGRAVRVKAADVGKAVEREPGDAVVTLVAAVGEPSQRVVVTRAAEAGARARELVAGDGDVVVAIGAPDDELRWFERRPLFGKRVLVTRAREQAGSAAAMLRDEGAEPLVVPAIAIEAPSDAAPLARAVAALRAGAYGWAAFTSANGVERTWAAIEAAGGDARAFGAARLAAIGPATAAALVRHGLRPDVVAREFRGEGLAEDMLASIATGKRGVVVVRVLLARAARARDALPEALRAAGCEVDVVPAYETRPASPDEPAFRDLVRELEAGRVDAVTFTSSSTVEHLCDILERSGPGPRSTGRSTSGGPARAASLLSRVRVASIGPVTSETARARGLRVDVEAAQYTVPGLIRALADSYANPVA
jgi:uroporphyrinogen III methyltransferase/synthase